MKTKINIEASAPANSRPAGIKAMLARLTCREVRDAVKVGYHEMHGWTARELWQRDYRLNRLMEAHNAGRLPANW